MSPDIAKCPVGVKNIPSLFSPHPLRTTALDCFHLTLYFLFCNTYHILHTSRPLNACLMSFSSPVSVSVTGKDSNFAVPNLSRHKNFSDRMNWLKWELCSSQSCPQTAKSSPKVIEFPSTGGVQTRQVVTYRGCHRGDLSHEWMILPGIRLYGIWAVSQPPHG
jgi:hypothetical protein